MALQTLEGAGVWVPSANNDFFESSATFVIDADGEVAVLVLRCPKAGDIDRFDAYVHTVANSPDNGLRFSIQGVTDAGVQDGTILGATSNGFVTYAHTVTTGWKQTNFGEVVTVTRNQLIACVIDIPTFTASDSVTIRSVTSVGSGWGMFPYAISATNTKSATLFPIIGLHYTDGYAAIASFLHTFESWAQVTYNSGTAGADEWGMGFQVPWPCKLNQVRIGGVVLAGADFECLVYNSSDSVISTLAHDGDVVGSTTTYAQFFTQSELTLAANTTYRVTIRPTTTANVKMNYLVFNSAAHMNTISGGDNFYMTSRLNQAGAWTDYNSGTFRRPHISLQLTALDDGVSTGGTHGSAFVG